MTRTIPRYLLVGLACAVLHNAIMIGCDLVGIHYVVSSLISYALVVVFGFVLHSWFTFEQATSLKSFLRFAAGMATNYPASIVLMFLLCSLAGMPVWIAAPLTTVILFVWNYVTTRWAVDKKSALEEAI